MVSWNEAVTYNEVILGVPFFRQFAVTADFSDETQPMLSISNQTISSLYFLPDATAEVTPDGKFQGIVAFVIVLVALAVFMLLAYVIWLIHQKMHARDMNWTPEDALETE